MEQNKTFLEVILGERLKSTLWRSYATSWVIWNWRVPACIFLYSDKDRDGLNSFDYIFENYSNIFDFLLFPLGFSVIYIFALPFLEMNINVFKVFIKVREYNRKEALEKDKVYTEEEVKEISNGIWSKYNNMEQQFHNMENQRDNLARENIELKNDRDDKVKELSILSTRHISENYFKGRFKRIDNTMGIQPNLKESFVHFSKNELLKEQNKVPQKFMDIYHFDADVKNNVFNFVLMSEGRVVSTAVQLKEIAKGEFEGFENNRPVTYIKMAG